MYDKTRAKIRKEIEDKRNETTLSVLQFSPIGKFIKRWNSTKETEIDGFKANTVKSCCAGDMTWYNEYIFIYEKDAATINDRVQRLKDSKIKKIPVLQYDNNGVLVKEWESVNSIEGFSKYSIKKCLKERTYVFKDYIWKYKYPELVYAD